MSVAEDMNLITINGLNKKDVGRLGELGISQTYILQYLLTNGRTKAAEFVRAMLGDGDADIYEWGENELDAN